ncbi:MAG TPA: DinB family protein [Rugosimonospora sp.]|nr:DinB family protein [Rugosimonospora sp.]
MVLSEVTRTDPPTVAGEREMLESWLDYHRATLLHKCKDLSEEQLKLRSAEPSSLSLLGLLRHMTDVENGWFGGFDGSRKPSYYYTEEHPDDDFDALDSAPAAEVVATFLAQCEDARQAAARHGLDETNSWREGQPISLRWIYVHMIEEYARHNGHADLIRERIDGATGE